MAFELNRILCKIIAQSTGGSFSASGGQMRLQLSCCQVQRLGDKPIVSFLSGRISDQSITPEWPRQHLQTKNVGIIDKIASGY